VDRLGCAINAVALDEPAARLMLKSYRAQQHLLIFERGVRVEEQA
jgi:hypothetical protein